MVGPGEKAIAIYTIYGAGEMTKRGRRQIANWLRRAADDLEELGKDYAPRIRGRYIVKHDQLDPTEKPRVKSTRRPASAHA